MENMKNTDLGRKDERLFVYLKVKEPSENDRLYYCIYFYVINRVESSPTQVTSYIIKFIRKII